MRWNHPEEGIINPDFFIPIAEKSNQIQDISKYVLNIYKIIKVLSTDYRRDEWSRNGYTNGQSDTHSRNCIILDSNII